jgi:hypothetical protein
MSHETGILAQLAQEGKTTFMVGPVDDLISLVHTTLVLNFPHATIAIDQVNKHQVSTCACSLANCRVEELDATEMGKTTGLGGKVRLRWGYLRN